MRPCPACEARPFSLVRGPMPVGPDGAQCPKCGTRVRFKRYGLYMFMLPTAMAAASIFSIGQGWGVKLFDFGLALGAWAIITPFWPLVVHPWDRTPDGETQSSALGRKATGGSGE